MTGLKQIVTCITGSARVTDFTYRFGGEEFVVIADGIGEEEALLLAERMRRMIAGTAAREA